MTYLVNFSDDNSFSMNMGTTNAGISRDGRYSLFRCDAAALVLCLKG